MRHRAFLSVALTTTAAIAAALCFTSCADKPTASGSGLGLPTADAVGGGSDTTATDTSGAPASDATPNSDAQGADAPIAAEECVAPGKGECDANSECGSDYYCDLCKRACLKPRQTCEPCITNGQCAKSDLGSACLPFKSGGTHCGLACLGDAGCPPSYACQTVNGVAAKQCVPKSGDCAPAAGQCKSDADCPYTTVCNADYGKCLKGCGGDKECPTGKVCSLFRCVEPCAGDAGCATLSAEAKCIDKHCTIPGGCLGPTECPEKQTHCDMAEHKCKPGCKTDFDCKEFGKKCDAGACIAKGCTENWECAFGQVCKPATGKCEKAVGPFCAKCDAKDEKVTACGGTPHKCLSFKDENDKEVGDFCLLACGTDPAGPCPQGYQCQDLKDQDGKSQGKVCVRQCWIDPFDDGTP